ncbi:MAG TPA: hypothetical protein VM557_12590 [Thermoanaerobaculia bacterium]|nr:hypothetical protein [Thermoanaerobaculia bacterium]
MTLRRPVLLFAIFAVLSASPALADWQTAYEDGIKAAQNGNWSVVVAKMTEAIREKPQEGKVRPSGVVFVDYYPYYYRGMAYFELGEYEKAVADLTKTTGVGKVKLADKTSTLRTAEDRLRAQNQPPPVQVAQQPPPTQTVPTQTVAPQPTAPAVDPNLAPARTNAREAIETARNKQSEAQRARGNTQPEFSQGQRLLREAESLASNADVASDWTSAKLRAEGAINQFDAAITRASIAAAKQPEAPRVAESATDDALAQKRQRVRDAVELYFAGDFRKAIDAFSTLADQEQNNALLWAFLGAAHYYEWYLNGERDDAERQNAITAFKKARNANGRLSLNERYFPPRVRSFYTAESR